MQLCLSAPCLSEKSCCSTCSAECRFNRPKSEGERRRRAWHARVERQGGGEENWQEVSAGPHLEQLYMAGCLLKKAVTKFKAALFGRCSCTGIVWFSGSVCFIAFRGVPSPLMKLRKCRGMETTLRSSEIHGNQFLREF